MNGELDWVRREEGPLGHRLLDYTAELTSEDLLDLARLARREYFDRRNRAEYLDDKLFGEPAWDILLDLFLRQVLGKSTSITGACIASTVPTTTALRWLQALIDHDLIQRRQDERDKRVSWITFTEPGFSRMVSILRARMAQGVTPSTMFFPEDR